MTPITEDEVWRLADGQNPPVIAKSEHDATESAVCLKRFPGCFILGVSSDTLDRAEFYRFDDEDAALAAYDTFARRMATRGVPFGADPAS